MLPSRSAFRGCSVALCNSTNIARMHCPRSHSPLRNADRRSGLAGTFRGIAVTKPICYLFGFHRSSRTLPLTLGSVVERCGTPQSCMRASSLFSHTLVLRAPTIRASGNVPWNSRDSQHPPLCGNVPTLDVADVHYGTSFFVSPRISQLPRIPSTPLAKR